MNIQKQIGLNILSYNQGAGKNRYYPTGSQGEPARHNIIGRQFVTALYNPNDADMAERGIYMCPSNPNGTLVDSLWLKDGTKYYDPNSPTGPSHPDAVQIQTNYYGWDEAAAQATDLVKYPIAPSSAARAGTRYIIVMDQDANGTPNHKDGCNALYADGHLAWHSYEEGFKDAASYLGGTELPRRTLNAPNKKVIPQEAHTPAMPRTFSSGGFECQFITSRNGR